MYEQIEQTTLALANAASVEVDKLRSTCSEQAIPVVIGALTRLCVSFAYSISPDDDAFLKLIDALKKAIDGEAVEFMLPDID